MDYALLEERLPGWWHKWDPEGCGVSEKMQHANNFRSRRLAPCGRPVRELPGVLILSSYEAT